MSLLKFLSFDHLHRKSYRARRVPKLFRRPCFEMLEARNLLATWYVDGPGGDGLAAGGDNSGPGTAGSPLLTVSEANSRVQPGDTVIIRGGTYNDLIDPNQSGNSGGKITYTNNANETVVIDGKAGTRQGVSTFLIDRQYIVLDGLDLSTDELTGATIPGIRADRSQNMEFRNLRIVNPYDVSQDFPVSPNAVPRGLSIASGENILVENVTVSGWHIGIAFGGSSQFVTIRNSVITNNIQGHRIKTWMNNSPVGCLCQG